MKRFVFLLISLQVFIASQSMGAIRLEDTYTQTTPASADYPGGSFKNTTTPGGTDGTPLEKSWADDFLGFRDAIMSAAGVGYSGAPDTAQSSDALNALNALFVNESDATSAATPNKVVKRDANGRFKAVAPTASDDVAILGTVTAHSSLTAAHGATSSATASRIILRDSSGRAQVSTPSASADIATKGYVDGVAAGKTTEAYVNGLAIGVGQTWQDVSASRTYGVNYQNTTGRPIQVSIGATLSTGSVQFKVGSTVGSMVQVAVFSGANTSNPMNAIIPAGHYYGISGACVINSWSELR